MNVSLPCGVFNTRYDLDVAIIRTKAHWTWLIGGIVASIFIPPMLGAQWLNWCMETSIVIIAVLGLYFITGLCGQISLGQAAFMAVGAYTTAILMSQWELSYWLVLPLAALTTGLVSIIFGLPSLRVKGFYLALATLAAQMVIIWCITHPPFHKWSGGFSGVTTPTPSFLSFKFDSFTSWFYISIVSMWILIYFAKNISRTRLGRNFVAVRDSDLEANVLGINVFKTKLIAFFIAGLYAGIAGSLFAPYIIRIAPENFSLEKSVWYLGMLVIGGSGSIVGAVVGAVFIRLLVELTVIFGPSIQVIPLIGPYISPYLGGIAFGLVVIIFLIFEPRGINHRWTMFKSSYRLHPFSY